MARMTKVAGSRGIELLPTLTGNPLTDQQKRGGMEFAIASLPPVRREIRSRAREAYGRARGQLVAIRAIAAMFGQEVNEWVNLELRNGRTDSTLVLIDRKSGHKGAMSIEYGRDPYLMEDEDGNTHEVGGMRGKFILHNAFRVPPGVLEGTGGGEIR